MNSDELNNPQKNKICSHAQDIQSYCKCCKLFCCDHCASDHIIHFKHLVVWTKITSKYIKNAENCQNIPRLLVKNEINIDSIKAQIFHKIDLLFSQIFEKFVQFKEQFKEEI